MIHATALKSRNDPTTLAHLKLIRNIMLTLGCWPEQAIQGAPRKTPFFTLFLILETFVHIVGQVYYIAYFFWKLAFIDLGNLYITLFLNVELFFRCIHPCLKKYGDIFCVFITKFHLSHFRYKSEFANDIFEQVNRVSSVFTVCTLVLSALAVITFNVAPLLANYRAGLFRDQPPENMTLEFSMYYKFPGFREEDHIVFCGIFNVWLSYTCAFVLTIMDLVLTLMVFQIIGHIRYLRDVFKHFPKPEVVTFSTSTKQGSSSQAIPLEVETVKNFNDQENEIIKKKIVECVKHHILIVNFTDDISNFFGPLLGMNYLYQLFTFSLLLVECMSGADAVMRYGPLTLMTLAQLSQLSIIFEVVHSESERLRDEVYYIPWESMSVSNQKSVLLLLRRMQTPIAVTAMGMTTVGVTTMGGILKTTFSYCTFIKSISN